MTQHDNPEQREILNSHFLTRKEKTAMTWVFGGDPGEVANNIYLMQIGNMRMTASLGMIAPFDIAIWGYGITRRAGSTLGTVEIRDNGIAVVSIMFALETILANYINEVTIPAGHVISAYWNSAFDCSLINGHLFCYVRP